MARVITLFLDCRSRLTCVRLGAVRHRRRLCEHCCPCRARADPGARRRDCMSSTGHRWEPNSAADPEARAFRDEFVYWERSLLNSHFLSGLSLGVCILLLSLGQANAAPKRRRRVRSWRKLSSRPLGPRALYLTLSSPHLEGIHGELACLDNRTPA